MNIHIHAGHAPAVAPGKAAGDPLAFPKPNTPEARKAIGALRRAARDEIERLVAFLDRTDADCDLEDGGDAEPWLGWVGNGPTSGDAGDDREDDSADDEDGGDEEEDDGERGATI